MTKTEILEYLGKTVELEYSYELPRFIDDISCYAFKRGKITYLDDKYLILRNEIRINIEEIASIKLFEFENHIVNNKLITPLGEFCTYIDDNECEYEVIAPERNINTIDTEGTYNVRVNFVNDGKHHKIRYDIKNENLNKYYYNFDSDEYFECRTYKNDITYLSVGVNAETISSDETEEQYMKYYEIDYIMDFFEYQILPTTKTSSFLYGISWLKNEENDENFFGSEPNDIHFNEEYKESIKGKYRFEFEKGEIKQNWAIIK